MKKVTSQQFPLRQDKLVSSSFPFKLTPWPDVVSVPSQRESEGDTRAIVICPFIPLRRNPRRRCAAIYLRSLSPPIFNGQRILHFIEYLLKVFYPPMGWRIGTAIPKATHIFAKKSHFLPLDGFPLAASYPFAVKQPLGDHNFVFCASAHLASKFIMPGSSLISSRGSLG